jgi:hypothetical protein
MKELTVNYIDGKFNISLTVSGQNVNFSLTEEDFKNFIFNLDSSLMDKLFSQNITTYDNINQ